MTLNQGILHTECFSVVGAEFAFCRLWEMILAAEEAIVPDEDEKQKEYDTIQGGN